MSFHSLINIYRIIRNILYSIYWKYLNGSRLECVTDESWLPSDVETYDDTMSFVRLDLFCFGSLFITLYTRFELFNNELYDVLSFVDLFLLYHMKYVILHIYRKYLTLFVTNVLRTRVDYRVTLRRTIIQCRSFVWISFVFVLRIRRLCYSLGLFLFVNKILAYVWVTRTSEFPCDQSNTNRRRGRYFVNNVSINSHPYRFVYLSS